MKKTSIRRSAAALAIGGAAAASFVAPANAAPIEAWEALAQCESGGNWSINTGNGFYGGLQFTQSSWTAAGGSGSPQYASQAEQIRVAENLLQMQGWGAWPACSASLNLYAYGTSSAAATVAEETTVAVQSETVEVVETPAVVETPVVVEEAPAVVETPAVVEETTVAAPVAEAPAAVAVETPAVVAETTVVAPAAPVAAANTYTVVAGDTLSEIAFAHGIYDWSVLAAANASIVPNPDVIEIGQVLTIPAI